MRGFWQPQSEHGGLIKLQVSGKQHLIAFTLPTRERIAMGLFEKQLWPPTQWPVKAGQVWARKKSKPNTADNGQRGSPPLRLFRLFFRFVLDAGEEKSRDSRRKGRGWGISTDWEAGIGAKLDVSMEVVLFSKGGETWEAAEKREK